MKKFILSIFLLSTLAVKAQTNLQVHYDFGEGRKYITSTLEMFKPDKWGNTYYFVDFDYNYDNKNHPSLAYMEIARCLKFWNGPLSAQIEYDGGLYTYKNALGVNLYAPINSAWLFGLDYGMNNPDFTKTLNLKALYKHIIGKQESVQFTAVWGLQLLKKKLSFDGFADFWFEDNTNINGSKTSTVFISEPQIWYNFTEHFSIGSEVEFATNFSGNEGLTVCPTLGVKWTF
jgi:hypothetical protein